MTLYIIIRNGIKACKLCQAVKQLTDFNSYTKANNKIYHRTACKECEKEMRVEDQKAYREANKEKLAQKKKEWVKNNTEKYTEYLKEYSNEQEVKERSKVKVVCLVCGTEIRKDGLKQDMPIHDQKNYDKNGLRIY
jgi:hypothetical protein